MKMSEESSSRPFFTVVTVCYNAGAALSATVEALRAQTCRDYEHIVKDAGSMDGSANALPEYPERRLIVSRDRGIYDAMNQAVAEAKGRFIYFLNCGDELLDDGVLERLKAFISQREIGEDAVIYGDCIYGGRKMTQPRRMTDFYLYRRPLVHQSMVCGREVFERYGVFDTELTIRADHEMTVRAFKGGAQFAHCGFTVCRYEGGGFSEKPENRGKRVEQLEALRCRHYAVKTRKKYDLRLALGLRGLRNKLASSAAPRPVRVFYRWVANLFNR